MLSINQNLQHKKPSFKATVIPSAQTASQNKNTSNDVKIAQYIGLGSGVIGVTSLASTILLTKKMNQTAKNVGNFLEIGNSAKSIIQKTGLDKVAKTLIESGNIILETAANALTKFGKLSEQISAEKDPTKLEELNKHFSKELAQDILSFLKNLDTKACAGLSSLAETPLGKIINAKTSGSLELVDVGTELEESMQKQIDEPQILKNKIVKYIIDLFEDTNETPS